MLARLSLVCACLIACSGGPKTDDQESYDYVVTPAGERFRVVVAGPILRGTNTNLGMGITYVAQAKERAELITHADTLVAVLGPELQLSGEKKLTVRARLGPPSVALDSSSYSLEYALTPDGYRRIADSQPKRAPRLAGTSVPEDPEFPYREQIVNAGIAFGMKWLTLLEQNDLAPIRAQLTSAFRRKVSDDAKLRELLGRRHSAGLPGERRELYRMQERKLDSRRAPGADVLVSFECTVANGSRVLERLVLSHEPAVDAWQIAGYAFQPLPELTAQR
jgi:hypothetical protein